MIDKNTKVGTKVRCINAYFPENYIVSKMEQFPVSGETYTVRDMVATYYGEIGVLLEEIMNPILHFELGDAGEPCFALRRFEYVS